MRCKYRKQGKQLPHRSEFADGLRIATKSRDDLNLDLRKHIFSHGIHGKYGSYLVLFSVNFAFP
jgi:hypothetical protein